MRYINFTGNLCRVQNNLQCNEDNLPWMPHAFALVPLTLAYKLLVCMLPWRPCELHHFNYGPSEIDIYEAS